MKKILVKGILSMILTATLVFVMSFPVFAETIPNQTPGADSVDIGNGQVMNENPEGGVVGTIEAGGTLWTNNGSVDSCQGQVYVNNGTVTSNSATSEVTTNTSTGTVTGGTVTNNFGTVNNGDAGDTAVTNNYGGTVGNGVTVSNQFWSVRVEAAHTSSSYGDDFSVSSDENDTRHYIQTTSNGGAITGSGTVTIAPEPGYNLGGQNCEGNIDGRYTYSLSKSGNNYTLVIINPQGNLTLDPTTLGLIVSAVTGGGDNGGGVTPSPSDVTENDDGSVTLTFDVIPGGQDGSGDGKPSGVTVNGTQDPMMNIINDFLKDHRPDSLTNRIDFGSNTAITPDIINKVIETMLSGNFYFTGDDGSEYVLYIPFAITPGIVENADFMDSIETLKKEPGGIAGPARLAEIFSWLGFRCVGVDKAGNCVLYGAGEGETLIIDGDTCKCGGKIIHLKPETAKRIPGQTHNTVMGAEVGMAALAAGNDFVGAATEGLAMNANEAPDGVTAFAQMGGGHTRQETG